MLVDGPSLTNHYHAQSNPDNMSPLITCQAQLSLKKESCLTVKLFTTWVDTEMDEITMSPNGDVWF